MSELEAWVEKLGAMSPNEIRDLMRATGVTGIASSGNECVLANFLREELGTDIGVCFTGITNYTQKDAGLTYEFVPLPASVNMFMIGFDHHLYPDLERA